MKEPAQLKQLLSAAIDVSLRAGKKIMEVYHQEDHGILIKDDLTPVTFADMKSHALIRDGLVKTDLPVLSEEGEEIPYAERKNWDYFWLIDPLDGTKEFIKGNGEFTVNIALIFREHPVLGVIYSPALNILYFGWENIGAFRIKPSSQNVFPDTLDDWIASADRLLPERPGRSIRVVGSRSHMSAETTKFIDHLREKYDIVKIMSRGSSLKICMVAEGQARIYPRLGPTMEWDTAAGHAIANASGCQVVQYHTGQPLVYNKEDLMNPWFVVKDDKLN